MYVGLQISLLLLTMLFKIVRRRHFRLRLRWRQRSEAFNLSYADPKIIIIGKNLEARFWIFFQYVYLSLVWKDLKLNSHDLKQTAHEKERKIQGLFQRRRGSPKIALNETRRAADFHWNIIYMFILHLNQTKKKHSNVWPRNVESYTWRDPSKISFIIKYLEKKWSKTDPCGTPYVIST